MLNPTKGHAALRRGRWSSSGAIYFLTMCTEGRKSGLDHHDLSSTLLLYARAEDADWHVRTAVVMPDHLHLMIELGPALDLPAAVRRFKGRTSVLLRARKLQWQRGCFDHRLRPAEDLLPVFQYIYLNPWRAGLAKHEQTWPGYFCAPEDWGWFGETADSSCILPQWLA